MCHAANDRRIDHVSISKSVHDELPHEVEDRRFEAPWEKARVNDGIPFELSVYRWKDIEPWVPDGFLAPQESSI
jgi:hypothetical protein